MPTVVALRLPWGQYHATPFGRSVNEAATEWPPSPWRILRALYCTWRFRAPEIPEGDVMGLLGSLAAPPSYCLPRHGEAHTRHYMPDVADRRDKVFDPFVVTKRDAEVLVRWDTALDPARAAVLAKLLDRLPYLGRAETICVGGVLSEAPDDARWLTPEGAAGTEPFARLLAAEEPLDPAALLMSTTEIRRAGRMVPPSTRWVEYAVPPVVVERPAPRHSLRSSPEVVRLVIDGPAKPSLYAAVGAGDLLRRAAMHAYGTPPSPALAGKDERGTPLAGHRHAHYLALDLDGDRLLDHLAVWAPGGLSDSEVRAVTGLRRLSTGQPVEGLHPVRVSLEAAGSATAALPELATAARTWVSHTPFAPPRHPSRKHDDLEEFVCSEVARELDNRSLPPATVEPVTHDWLRFRRRRLSEHLGHDRRAFGLRLHFAEPVPGPLCLGALSHFGLGVFAPESRD